MKPTRVAQLLTTICVLWLAAPAEAEQGRVSVFNFQMKSNTPEWRWMEKGLADRVITDLFQKRTVSVIQRDRMQELAAEMAWAPEMMGDTARLKKIGQTLGPNYLVSGVYEVKGKKLKIIAVIVDFKTNNAVARREVSGQAADALELTRKLSASLLSWLTKRPEEKILDELPAWTRSIPAVKALYEGMDLYDQGRYAEAWLGFRQASRKDPAYVEAQYWVGKMYYFMDRYRHARRAYERFVYLDSRHPRLGDAIREYIHTYEKLHDTPAETLLALYAEMIRRYPRAQIFDAMAEDGYFRNDYWLKAKTGRVLEQAGRHKEAMLAAAHAEKKLEYVTDRWGSYSSMCRTAADRISLRNMFLHYLTTGERLGPAKATGIDDIRFGKEVHFKLTGPVCQIQTNERYHLLAPEGHVFVELAVRPMAKAEGAIKPVLWHIAIGDIPAGHYVRVGAAERKAIRIKGLPRISMLSLFVVWSRGPDDPEITKGTLPLRVEAKFEKIPSRFGAVEVFCSTTPDFRVRVGDRMGRKHPGLIGLLPAGVHELTFVPAYAGTPFGQWQTKVTVRPGKTTRVIGQLPWPKGSGWSSWSCTAIGPDYDGHHVNLRPYRESPSIQADNDAIRIVWSYGDDIWASLSTDGKSFSRPRKLRIPVSSGWLEWAPRLFRDESGRFILVFESDRNARHQFRPYVCWSRDFEHWSAPVMISDARARWSDMIQDDKGRFIWAYVWLNKVTVMASRDAYRWQKLGEATFESFCRGVQILQRSDGDYELYVPVLEFVAEPTPRNTYWLDKFNVRIFGMTSRHGRTWRLILRQKLPPNSCFSTVHNKEGTMVAAFFASPRVKRSCLRINRYDPQGRWSRSPTREGVGNEAATFAHHPRWGYMISWMDWESWEYLRTATGPYLMRSGSIKPLFDPYRRPTEMVREMNNEEDTACVIGIWRPYVRVQRFP
ncbi:MAG: hypothetical protein ACYTF6_11445 [Planctomycetota bacterium]|jgi:TolB-like protein